MLCHKRLSSLETVKTAVITLKHRLCFTLGSPIELLNELKADERFKSCDYILNSANECEQRGFETAWKTAVLQSELPFEENDRAILLQVGSILGKSDLETQLNQFDLLLEQLSAEIAEYRGEMDKKQRLYSSLGILLGVGAAVMLF